MPRRRQRLAAGTAATRRTRGPGAKHCRVGSGRARWHVTCTAVDDDATTLESPGPPLTTPIVFQPRALPDVAPPPAAAPPMRPFGDDGLTFGDLIDVVNPLHHIPLLGNLYRKLTGDTIDPAIRVAGGALFGGPLGAGFAAASLVLQRAMTAPDAAPVEQGTDETTRVVRTGATAPGGWMVATARPVRFAPAQDTVAERPVARETVPRRGGWIAQAAYAMADSRAARGRVDTTA